MPDIKPSEVEYYWEIYVDILLNNRIIQTQDTTLLMTAVINEADYFVTADDRLIGIAGDSMFADYDMQLITPGKAYEILKNRLD
jgi:predicted nucleic acid-binding protein